MPRKVRELRLESFVKSSVSAGSGLSSSGVRKIGSRVLPSNVAAAKRNSFYGDGDYYTAKSCSLGLQEPNRNN